MDWTFATLPLSGCSGCEVGLLNSEAWIGRSHLAYMPLVISADDLPPVDTLLVTGGVGTEDDEYRLRLAASAPAGSSPWAPAPSPAAWRTSATATTSARSISPARRRQVPRILPKCHPIDDVVPVDLYLPGCPPMGHLYIAALFGLDDFRPTKTVCIDCGRKKTRDRPAALTGFQSASIDPELCLINQGYLCIGSSTRGGCGAPCTRAGNPCVGCRGPSDGFISRSREEWFTAIKKVFARMTDIPPEVVDDVIRSPQYSLFTFQFADYTGRQRDPEKVL